MWISFQDDGSRIFNLDSFSEISIKTVIIRSAALDKPHWDYYLEAKKIDGTKTNLCQIYSYEEAQERLDKIRKLLRDEREHYQF